MKLFKRELSQMRDYKIAERVDHARPGLIDVLFAYRLLLGRWPEFDSVSKYYARSGNQDLLTLVMSFIKSPEF